LTLQKKGIFLKPFIIGIGMENDYRDAFGCMGEYYDAKNTNDFRKALSKAVNQSLGQTTISVELLDENKRPTETNVNVSFINSNTQNSVFEFVHYRDRNGKPDSVEIDPVLSYDIVVNTTPHVIRKNISFEGGKHTTIPIQVPQGYVSVNFPGAISYKNGVQCLIKDPNNGNTLTVFNTNESVKLLAGKYTLEILTLPVMTIKNLSITPKETNTITIDKPGLINFISSSLGIASLYQLDGEGKQSWVYNLNSSQLQQSVTIQPGKYKVVFRSEKAKGSKFTKVQEFTVNPGSSITIRL
jgi:Ca-activated chloride channel family protein